MAQPFRRTLRFVHPVTAWLVVGLVFPPVAWGQTANPGRPLSRDAIQQAVSRAQQTSPPPASASDWTTVGRLPPGADVVVVIDGRSALEGDVIAADEGGLTIRGRDGTAERIPRPSVIEVRDVSRRGSKRNAVIGAGAGAFLGYLLALNVAFRDCGGNCNDERLLMGVALVGTPVAGGLIGYHAVGRRNQIVYRRPAP